MTRSTAMAAGTGLQQFVIAKSTAPVAPAAVAGATPGGKKATVPTFPAENLSGGFYPLVI